ncbi:hypothetical protein cypCar_00041517, partial [Cyprinus carpio]
MMSKSICLFIIVVILTQGISGDEIRLDQSPAEIKRPGETVKISCKISGFTMTDYNMHWIRQKPGKALEWIGRVDSGRSSRSDYLIYDVAYSNEKFNTLSHADRTMSSKLHSVYSQVVLTQSEQSVVVSPGASYKLTCDCSGFTLSSYRMHWIRQAPGKGLEWILYYYTDSEKGSAQSVQGRASQSSSNLYLHMSQLKTEDTQYVYSSVEHIQPSSLLVKPGESFTISCKISGYALSDSSKAPSWIRLNQGKILEFIGMIHAGGGIDYKDSLKNKFIISRETSTSTVYLKGQNLQTEDTAVYYCVRYTGTMMNSTVSGQSLTSSDSVVKKPGESVTVLHCVWILSEQLLDALDPSETRESTGVD